MRVERIPEDALIERYHAAQQELREAAWPELTVESYLDEDGEPASALRCPRCGDLIGEGELRAVSPAESWDYNEEIDVEVEVVPFGQPDNPDLEDTLYITHGDSPGHGVSLPEGWTEDWG